MPAEYLYAKGEGRGGEGGGSAARQVHNTSAYGRSRLGTHILCHDSFLAAIRSPCGCVVSDLFRRPVRQGCGEWTDFVGQSCCSHHKPEITYKLMTRTRQWLRVKMQRVLNTKVPPRVRIDMAAETFAMFYLPQPSEEQVYKVPNFNTSRARNEFS